MKAERFQNRTRVIFFLFFCVGMVFIIHLYILQVVEGDQYSERADRQYTNVSSNTFDRGRIFFLDKNNIEVSAATMDTGYILALNISIVDDKAEEYYKKLTSIIPIEANAFYAKTAKKGDPYEEIARRLSREQVDAITALKLPGVILEQEKWRSYPGKSLAARVIGFLGYNDDGTILEGRYGLEKYYDKTLARDTGTLYVNIFAELFSNISDAVLSNKSREGDIVTRIDPELQGYAEKIIADTRTKWNAEVAGAIIIDPKEGGIYSMAISPTFDLNNFRGASVSVFGNPLVSDAYEMGSIIKPLTMAAGLDAGVVTAKTTFQDRGSVTLDGRTVYNFDKKVRGTVDMQAVLDNSLNTGATFVMQQLGKESFLNYFKGYGLGTETGIDLPAEAAGNIGNLVQNLTNTKQIEYATASFGQGISMTPIMTTRALSVLANGGKLIIPHIAQKINYKVGLSKTISYESEAKQVLKKETSEEISRMLVSVVDHALLGGSMKMEHYSIAAKTGTAQMARPAAQGGGYYPDRYLHSFFGYFPAYNPRFLVFLYVVDPKGVNYASQTLTSPFFDLAKYLINYYEIPPDR